jgi:hypothetical protein
VEASSVEFLRNYVLREQIVSFQILLGVPEGLPNLVVRPIDERDLGAVQIVLGQMRGRTLPIASAKFADQLSRSLAALMPPAITATRAGGRR